MYSRDTPDMCFIENHASLERRARISSVDFPDSSIAFNSLALFSPIAFFAAAAVAFFSLMAVAFSAFNCSL